MGEDRCGEKHHDGISVEGEVSERDRESDRKRERERNMSHSIIWTSIKITASPKAGPYSTAPFSHLFIYLRGASSRGTAPPSPAVAPWACCSRGRRNPVSNRNLVGHHARSPQHPAPTHGEALEHARARSCEGQIM